MNYLFQTGYEFETPIPMITPEGAKPFPPTGYRQLDARTNFFYGITGITPGMAMRLPGIGSQYLFALQDANTQYFDGAKTYKVTLPSHTLFQQPARGRACLRRSQRERPRTGKVCGTPGGESRR